MNSCKEEESEIGTKEMSEVTKWMGEGINPCLIPHVADQIIQYLLPNTKLLRQARLVCEDWSISASQSLRKVTRARIGEHCTNVQKLSEFLSLVEEQGMNIVSVTNFTFCQDVFQVENEAVIKKFLLMYFSILESFTLWFDLKSTMPFDNEGFLFTSPFQCDSFIFPKLKHIEWDDRRSLSSSRQFGNSGPKLLEWLLSRCPSLQSLSIHFESQSNLGRFGEDEEESPSNYETDEFLLRILSPDGPFNPKSLKSLHLDINLTDNLLKTLSEFFLKAKLMSSLTLCVRGSNFLPESFENMLTSVKERMQKLRIISLCDKSNCVIRFPESLERLRLLEIAGWNVGSGNIGFSAFSLSRNFPVIRTLILDCWSDKPEWWQFIGGMSNFKETIETVVELVLPEEVVSRARIPDIVKVFPNLKKLDFPISSEELEVLEVVFECCTGLTDLTVRRSSSGWTKSKPIVDSIFTGIPQDICTKLLRSRSLNLNSRVPVISGSLSALRTKPGITNLTNLKRLEIKDLQYLVEVSDVTGILAFLELDSLEYLNCGRSMMSTSCLNKLAEKFPQNMAYQSKLERISPPFKGERSDEENYLRDIRKCAFL